MHRCEHICTWTSYTHICTWHTHSLGPPEALYSFKEMSMPPQLSQLGGSPAPRTLAVDLYPRPTHHSQNPCTQHPKAQGPASCTVPSNACHRMAG